MARRQCSSSGCGLAVAMLAVLSSVLCSGHPVPGGGFPLQPHFYDHACPQMQAIVGSIVAKAHAEDPRMAASLLRLHFHDCFVQGCDASVLLDSTPTQPSEQLSPPNLTLRPAAFKAVNDIRARLEQACGRVVSCADIVALAARESVALVRVVRVVYAIAFFVALYIHLRTVNKVVQSYAYMLYSLDCCGMHPTHTYFILYFSFLL